MRRREASGALSCLELGSIPLESRRRRRVIGNLRLRFVRSNGERNATIAVHNLIAFKAMGVFGKLSDLEDNTEKIMQFADEGKAAIQSSLSQSLQEVIPKLDSIVRFVDTIAKVSDFNWRSTN